MWSPRPRRLTLAGQFLALQLIVIALVLSMVAAISVHQSTQEFRDVRGRQMQSIAEYVANQSVVRSEVATPEASRVLAHALTAAQNLSGAADATIADPDGIVIASTDPTSIRDRAPLGTSEVRDGRGWRGDVDVDGVRSVAGHTPILDDEGTLIGLVLVSDPYPSVWQRLVDAAPDLTLLVGIGGLLCLIGSWLLSRFVRRRTRGLEPREIATLADHREALLHSIGDGVIAVSQDGRVTVINDSACELLGLSQDSVGRSVHDLGLPSHLVDVLTTGRDAHDEIVLLGDRVLVLDQRTASSAGEGIGAVTIVRDRTELVAMRSRLSSNLAITDTLRSQTHEFANQLHTISGLVQLGEYDEVTTLVGNLTRRRAEISDWITGRIADKAVAALLVAKTSVASEAGVRLDLDGDSSLPVLDAAASADLTTILGNLIDNAIDACRAEPEPRVEVVLEHTGSGIHLEVCDNGPGVPDELSESIFVRGFSTKSDDAEVRGIGLPLVRMICDRRGGTATVRRDSGARFVVDVGLSPVEVGR
ncbi:ATP-binding protein [Aeromicrobium sp.]|uniref:sensor histidine kinase n=1 Tax=Aeromicrobium sp. TaxID=1871063 RepID=UPI003C648992